MKQLLLFGAIALILLLAFSRQNDIVAAEATIAADSTTVHYIGVKDCAKCHKKTKEGAQLKIWKKTKHANAYKTLQSEEAVKIATEMGLAKAAHESEQCLKCHVTAYNVDLALHGKKFDVSDGVQCETCHGPGSLYKKKKIMKDREKSIEMGMTPIFVEDGSAERQCLECHNEESPTYKPFDFAKAWKEIEHPVPKK